MPDQAPTIATVLKAMGYETGIISGLDWLPMFAAVAGDPNIADELKKGRELNGRTYKVYLDGYDQTGLITGKAPSSRHEIFYFAVGTSGAVRLKRLQIPVYRPAGRLDRRDGARRLADPGQSPARSLRADELSLAN
jgi:hypothetical protein